PGHVLRVVAGVVVQGHLLVGLAGDSRRGRHVHPAGQAGRVDDARVERGHGRRLPGDQPDVPAGARAGGRRQRQRQSVRRRARGLDPAGRRGADDREPAGPARGADRPPERPRASRQGELRPQHDRHRGRALGRPPPALGAQPDVEGTHHGEWDLRAVDSPPAPGHLSRPGDGDRWVVRPGGLATGAVARDLMLVRRVAWRLAGRVTDRGLPAAAARAYYREVAASLARALDRLAGVRAVYAWGTFATGDERPGHSDVDLVAVIDDVPPADEVRLLQAIRARYARRQAVLPIDLTVLSAGELAPDAPLHELIRLRVADERPGLALGQWRLLAGEELRPGGAARPPAHLRYISDGRLQAAIAALAMGRESEARALLARLSEDGGGAGSRGDALRTALARLEQRRDTGAAAVDALHAALALVDEP